MALTVQLFTATGAVAAHPTASVTVPAGYKILGGGAFDHYTEPGNLLTASYPQTLQTWFVAGKDHEQSSPASITAFALAVNDPTDEWDVTITKDTSVKLPHPQAEARVPPNYVLTGGGAFVDYGTGPGNLLTASFPATDSSWQARSKDHDVKDPAQITAYAIGIKHRALLHRVQHIIVSATGAAAAHPSAQAMLPAGYTMSGGGAFDDYAGGQGNILTASYPQSPYWIAAGKDHVHSSPATMTAYVIGIQQL